VGSSTAKWFAQNLSASSGRTQFLISSIGISSAVIGQILGDKPAPCGRKWAKGRDSARTSSGQPHPGSTLSKYHEQDWPPQRRLRRLSSRRALERLVWVWGSEGNENQGTTRFGSERNQCPCRINNAGFRKRTLMFHMMLMT
jgi:hypothetical protein